MDKKKLQMILQSLYEQKLNPKEVMEQLATLPYENLDFAKIDHHRSLRNDMAEIVYGKGKTANQLIGIIKALYQAKSDVLVTKLDSIAYKNIQKKIPSESVYDSVALTLVINNKKQRNMIGHIAIVSAGTADIPIAEEAKNTAEFFGSKVEKVYDVGVAGLHRLLDKINLLRKARVIIVIAGMDGALVAVIGGLVSCPIIAVPTNIGYGASFNGVAALLTMLNSCATGVATVNIDNGFGAGCIAHKINLLGEKNNH
jgi:pyridinium-3,5-biscarboxylic acid mononucleotide synthase